jgi:hypothetical protein
VHTTAKAMAFDDLATLGTKLMIPDVTIKPTNLGKGNP